MGQNRMAEGKSASWDLPKWVKTKAWKMISTGDRKFFVNKVCVNNGQLCLLMPEVETANLFPRKYLTILGLQ